MKPHVSRIRTLYLYLAWAGICPAIEHWQEKINLDADTLRFAAWPAAGDLRFKA